MEHRTASGDTDWLLKQISHRPYELPRRPWAMIQTWSKLLFAHWPVRAEELQKLMPSVLPVDTYDGVAWIGVVPFAMNNVCFRYLRALPSNFLELNVRTYVTYKGRRGVYFFSLDASHPIAVEVARAAFRLPYYHSRAKISGTSESVIYKSERSDWRGAPVVFDGSYGATGEVQYSTPGSIEEFLTERYCFFTEGSKGRVVRCDIHHDRWPLQAAEADLRTNTMLQPLSLNLLKSEPLLYYSDRLETIEWFIERCDD